MTSKAAARIQSATAKQHGGKVPAGTFASRAQRAAAKSGGSNNSGNKGSSGNAGKTGK